MASNKEAGFSLIEVLVALGLMAGVMVAVCSMFVLGGTYVKSGKELTQATALGQDMMEDINKQSYSGVYLFLQGASPDPNATSVTSDTRVSGSVANTTWGGNIRSKLYQGYAVVTMIPIGGTATPTTFATGEGIRVSITLGWKELRRTRSVKLENVRW
ncbi:MAG TPA: prepilin-type N-terminal cleavage/methylation domain-containing protein [Patescibacteria group bacterium]|nr:prepilin-type N-terminal cleavage/methylation domain-containing protein [Patescibacteria group bacterium]